MRTSVGKDRIFFSTLFFVIAVLAGSVLMAQTASLSGTVTDPQNRVIPGVTVILISSTGAERVAISDDAGRYVFPQVAPGNYELRAEMPGFKTVVQRDLRLLVDTAVTANLQFTELGEISDTIIVTGERAINTVDATLGHAISDLVIDQIPLESRNVVAILSVQPGVTRQGYVTGARSDQSNITLDGVDVNEQQEGTAFESVLRITPDSVQEFRVTTANPNANQGRSSGAQVSLITKSGSNQWKGTLYHFHRNTVTTANNFFNNRVTPRPLDRPALLRNLFGGSVGGPIVRDKAFFFVNYEGRRDRKQESVLRTVPLAHLGQGMIRYDSTEGFVKTLTLDELNAIYPVGINPLAMSILGQAAQRYPSNDDGAGDGLNTGGFRFNAPLPVDQNAIITRLDFNMTDTQQLFLRGNYQWDLEAGVPQFPDTPGTNFWNHPIGVAAGHTWTASSNLVNRFTYGLTRQAFSNQGDSADNLITFRFVYEPRLFVRTLARTTPVHNFADDVSWLKGNHHIQFGTNIRVIRNQRSSFANAFDSAITNPSFYDFSGAVVSDPISDIAGSRAPYQAAATALIGRYSQYSGRFTFGVDGSLLPPGTPTDREFATEEYEFYGQDSWRALPGLTLTYGLRFGTSTPVHERTGFQVKPTTSLGGYFEQRKASAAQGIPFNDPITVDLAGPFHNRSGYYEQEWNVAPRVAAAWSPNFQNGFLRTLFGEKDRSVIRGGFGMLYDRIGSRLAVHFDLNNTLGFTSEQTIAANTYNVTDRPAPLFSGFDQQIRNLPGIIVPDALVFPLMTPADGAQRIESSLDDTLKSPVNYTWNLTLSREFTRSGLTFEASYIGRKARDLMATRDIMALNNIVDPQSGMDWYSASRILADARLADVPIDQLAPVAYFENLFPAYVFPAGDPLEHLSPTQRIYRLVSRDGFDILDWTFIQLILNRQGVHDRLFFHPQYAALSTFSTVAYSDYHAFTFSARQRMGNTLSADVNYTLGKSIDNASGLQTSGAFGAAFILNPLRPDDQRSLSDFHIKHVVNANWLFYLPVGRGRTFLNSLSGPADALLGGWQLHGIFRWDSGLPQGSPFDQAQWATNWNVQSDATRLRDPGATPTKSGAHPSAFQNAAFAYNSYRNAFPGETGDRNVLQRQGYVAVDFGLGKAFGMPYAEDHRLEFRWEVFNATNTQRLGAAARTRANFGLDQDPHISDLPPNWGNITSIQGEPRVMQFGLKYYF